MGITNTTADGDKRTVSTDALETLGYIIGPGEKRDAIHLAVEPVIAQEELLPGQDVGIDGTTKSPVGIVDPFLKTSVNPGERFWLVVYPRQITSLRHVWTHPAFPEEDDIAKSKKWIEDFAATCDRAGYDEEESRFMSYDDLMEAAEGWIKYESIVCFPTTDYPNLPEEFWDHYEVVMKTVLDDKIKRSFFKCAC